MGDIQEKIAKRILASIYSWYTIEDGKAYAFLDDRSRPCYYVERNAKNSYRVIKFDKAQFSSQEGRGMFNAILVSLKMGNDKTLKTFKNCIISDRTISAGKAVAPLLDELGMTLPEFERMFRTETDFTSGSGLDERKYRKWRIVFEKGTRSPEQVLPLLDRVEELLGGFSKALCYGIVEIKNDLPPNVLADYTPKNDAMRVKSDSDDERIYHCFLHEISHRLWFKLMSKAQRHSIEDKYRTMKHNPSAVLFNESDEDGDVFPSEYSKTSVEEFFAECFAFWRTNELCESLSKFLKNMFFKKKRK